MKVALTGATGMLGTAISQAWSRIRPTDELYLLSRDQVDLTNDSSTFRFMDRVRPDIVIHTAAKVGGIAARMAHPTTFLLDNVLIDSHVFSGAISSGVENLVYFSSAAAYPEIHEGKLNVNDLLTGPLEGASEGYGLSKLVGAKLCSLISDERGWNYRALVTSNLYGPQQGGGESNSHMISSVLSRILQAHASGHPSVEIWGDGKSRREFTFTHDVANWLSENIDGIASWPSIMNLGYGLDFSIDEYYEWAAELVGYKGKLVHDATKPNGSRQRLLDSTEARKHGWNPATLPKVGMAKCLTSYSVV